MSTHVDSATTATTTPNRRTRRWARAVGLAIASLTLVGAHGVIAAAPASAAAHPWCAKRAAHGTHVVQKWVWAGGWGWTNWQVKASVWAADLCDRGEVNVSVTIPDNPVARRGGNLKVLAWARYYNSASRTYSQWIALKLVGTWPSYTFRPPNGSHIAMNRKTHTAWTYCGLMYTSPGVPGQCSG